MSWGKEWPNTNNTQQGKFNTEPMEWPKPLIDAIPISYASPIVFIDPNKDLVKSEIISIDKETVTIREIEKVYNNKVPTHDPYTNPDAQIYYQCNCGAILDPGTKSFAALNNCASEKGWKVRWGQEAYQPFCVDCGKDVE